MRAMRDTLLKLAATLIFIGCLIVLWPKYTMVFFGAAGLIIALFKDLILSFYVPPKLEITVSARPEHFHEVDDHDELTDEFKEKQAWLGVIVRNTGFTAAKNIECFFTGIKSTTLQNFGEYQSILMKRSWLKESIVRTLPRCVGIRFDVCYLREPTPEEINFKFVRTPNALRKIKCPTESISTFKCMITAVAENAPICEQAISITFTGHYMKGFDACLINKHA